MATDSNTEKIIKAVANGLSALRMEMLSGFKEVNKRIDDLGAETNKNNRKVNKRLDKIGLQLAYIEDDAPTREDLRT